MDKCAYLVNSTPKFYGLLPLHFTLVKRYAPWLDMPMFLATEEPNHPICQQVKEMGVELILLRPSEAGFLDSRAIALQQLALTGRFTMVLPVQEDFLLERDPDPTAILEAIRLLQLTCASVRLMPCPGPGGSTLKNFPDWALITPATDTYGFTFQATIWRLDACVVWYRNLCAKLEAEWPVATTPADKRRDVEIRGNFAENPDGQRFFWKHYSLSSSSLCSNELGNNVTSSSAEGALWKQGGVHVGWKRAGPWSNAVYMSPWPYRPTAVIQGRLEPWAAELGQREGVPISLST